MGFLKKKMKLSTRSRYGVRFMLDLAQDYNKEPIQLSNISKNQKISNKYLTQIVYKLKKFGLIKSERGAYGGYFLAKSPEKITLKEIVENLENGLYLVPCVKNPEVCDKSNKCVFHNLWVYLSENIKETLEKINLEDLCKVEKGEISLNQILKK